MACREATVIHVIGPRGMSFRSRRMASSCCMRCEASGSLGGPEGVSSLLAFWAEPRKDLEPLLKKTPGLIADFFFLLTSSPWIMNGSEVVNTASAGTRIT